MIALVENLSVLLIFAFAGWLLGKRRILSSENLKLLSVLEIWVFLPCNCLRSFAKNFTVAYIQEKYPLILISVGIVVVLTLANAFLVPRFVKGAYLQKVIRYTLTLPNYGYVGYPLIQSVYGELMLLNAQVFAIPMSIYSGSEGYRLLTNGDSVSLKKVVSPSLVAMAIGAGIGPCCFETDRDVADAMTATLGDEAAPYLERRGVKWHVDLAGLNRLWLLRAGVLPQHMETADLCTACHPEWFWSHRKMGSTRGSMAAVIQLI